MRVKPWLHKLTSIVISLSLGSQLILPAWGLFPLPRAQSDGSAPVSAISQTVDTASTEARAAAQPPVLDAPITVSRLQSSYQAGGSLTISYTVSSSLPPTHLPEIPETATVTETADLLAAYAITDDANTLRQVVLSTTLQPGTSLLDASGTPSQQGSTLSWTLDDIPPQQNAIITITVQPPASAADFIELDGGASVSAQLWQTAVTADAHPALLAPDSIDPAYLTSTAAADVEDADMLWKMAALSQDPLAMFEYVKGFAFDPYQGALRGTRGTLWGEAGNAVDQSSLLIAALRAAGVPARYRHGTLADPEASALLSGIFAQTAGAAGYVPPTAAISDPANDPALLDIVRDHWWVEAYLPGSGWTDLDPSFANAAAGQTFAAPAGDQTDRSAGLPDALHHTISMSLVIEQYSEFPVGGSFLNEITPLTATFKTAEVAAKQVELGQFVEDGGLGGAVFGVRQISYQPYFGIRENGDAVLGDPFQDMLSSFPFSTVATMAAWIDYEITDPDGQTQSFRRPIKDLLGADVRLNGGTPALAIDAAGPPFLTADEQYVHWVLPNAVPEWAYTRRLSTVIPGILALGSAADEALQITGEEGDPLTPEQSETLNAAASEYMRAQNSSLRLTGLRFAWLADDAFADIEDGLRVNMYYTSPRLFAVGASLDLSGTLQVNVDLRATQMEAIAAAGQSTQAAQSAQWLKGVVESRLEGDVLELLYDGAAVTTANLFAGMAQAGLAPVMFQPEDISLLDHYPFSAEAKAHMTLALIAGKTVLAPPTLINLNDADHIAWWEIDPVTGEIVSVGEDGLRPSAMEWTTIEMLADQIIIAILELLLNKLLGLDEVSGGWGGTNPGATSIAQLAELLLEVGTNLSMTFFGIADALGGEQALNGPLHAAADVSAVSSWQFLPAHLCPVDSCGIEQFFLAGGSAQPIPLPHTLFSYVDAPADASSAAMVPVSASLPAGDPAFTLSTSGGSGTQPGNAVAVNASIASSFSDTFTLFAYAPERWTVTTAADGQITVEPPRALSPGEYTLLLVAHSPLHPTLTTSALHTITITAPEAVSFSYQPETNLTVPMGDAAFEASSAQTNDGEAEIPDAAFKLELANNTGQTRPVTITVSGAPAGWVILNGQRSDAASFDLPAEQLSTVGLYLMPDTVPAPGTSFTMDVQLNDGADVTNVAIPWTMPGQPFNHLQVETDLVYLAPYSSVDLSVTNTNVGSLAGSFPITVSTPISGWAFSPLSAAPTLTVGQTDTQTTTLTIGDAVPGRVYPVLFSSPAPGSYTQYALADVRVVSQNSGSIFQAANSCSLGSESISASLETLALAVADLEYWCEQGDCPLVLRDQVADAAESAAAYAGLASASLTADAALLAAAGTLRGHDNDADIAVDVVSISAIVTDLETELCEIEQHYPTARFSPTLGALLLDDTATYTLTVTNQGTQTTTYVITAQLPERTDLYTRTIAPGAAAELPLVTTPDSLGTYMLQADIAATGPDVELPVETSAVARLNVVDRFVELASVTPDPAFVETGSSSTAISIDVANIAQVAQEAAAQLEILGPDGGSRYSAAIPLTILIGQIRSYPLDSVDTSGWAEGVYTVTVDLLDGDGSLIPDGSGYGLFSVGQAMAAYQQVQPEIVAPGTVTVSTILTTEILAETILPQDFTASLWPATGLRAVEDLEAEALLFESAAQAVESASDDAARPGRPAAPSLPQSQAADAELSASLAFSPTGIYTRTEENDPDVSFTGIWASLSRTSASGSRYTRGDAPGETAVFTFTGSLVTVGFMATNSSGHAEIFLDGSSIDIVDLYRREETPLSFTYNGLASSSHVISVTVLGTTHPNALNDFVQLDYFDYWAGQPLPDGYFEQDDDRIAKSGGWAQGGVVEASGGTYLRGSSATAWFPFSGSSFSFQALAYTAGGDTQLYLDGAYLTTVDLYSWNTITRTFSFTGFTEGPHLLQVTSYRGQATLDSFATPGTAPFTDPQPAASGFTRYEEDHTAFLYNGVPFTQTNSSWVRQDASNYRDASGGQHIFSSAGGDTASLDFTGEWAAVGFYTNSGGGSAEIFIDGSSQGVFSTYSREDSVTSFTFPGLGAGGHTISMTLQGDGNVRLDFVDVWDGSPIPSGTFQQDQDAFYLSADWTVRSGASAQDGTYLRTTLGNVWFPFTGDSVSYHVYNDGTEREARIFLDDQFLGIFNLGASGETTPTLSFSGLTSTVHVLRVEDYRGYVGIDAFSAPAAGAPYVAPGIGDYHRFEEDASEILYNGVPYTQTATSWTRVDNSTSRESSDAQWIHSNTVSDTISFSFSGEWVSIGFGSDASSGSVEIFIDGISQGIFNSYLREAGVSSRTFPDIGPGSHTLTMTVQGDGFVRLDYIDVWNGAALPDGTFDSGDGRFYLSDGWAQRAAASAYDGNFLRSNSGTAWFPFTGSSVSLESYNDGTLGVVQLFVDDRFQGNVDLSLLGSPTGTVSIDGLGSGVHILRLEPHQNNISINAFVTPGVPPFFQPPETGPFTRYEEEHPGILYNGSPFTQTVTSWTRNSNFNAQGASGGQYIVSSTPGDVASFQFDGAKVGLGFMTSIFGGQVEIFIDGATQGVKDLFNREEDIASFYYDVVSGTHTISFTVLSTNHPNVTSNGRQARLDFIDVWDGTSITPDSFTEDSIYVHTSGDFGSFTDAGAEDGQYQRGGRNAWILFTGDAISYQAMAYNNGARFGRVSIDGVYQGLINLYALNPISRTFTFSGLGEGGHVLHIDAYRGEGTIDGFTTPGSGAPYQFPTFSGLVRHEENSAELRYNGVPFGQRPSSWSTASHTTASEGYVINSNTVDDTISLTFDGVWANIGIRARSVGGTAELFIDGQSHGTIDFYNAVDTLSSVQVGGLLTTTHTISLVVTSGYVSVDYIDTWDGSQTSDAFQNADKAELNSRIHLGGWLSTYENANAIEEDFTSVGIFNFPGSTWYTFVGDSFTYYAFGRDTNGSVDVYIDGVYTDTVDMRYEFTSTPLAYHFTGLAYGAHVVRLHSVSNIRVDGFAANPESLTPYQPMVEWFDRTGAGNGAPFAGTFGVISTVAAGDVDGDGTVELAVAADDMINWGTLFLYRGDGGDTGDGDPIIWSQVIGDGFSGRAYLGAPVMADLDGSPGAEIVVAGNGGVYAYHNDGTLYWHDDTVSGSLARGNPAVGNLDLDAAPEIVVNMDRTLLVYEADGTQAYSTTLPAEAGLPMLADMTGDGLLDIVLADWDDNVHLFDYNLGIPQLVWSTPLSTSLINLFGAPAIANIDGKQPGGDPGPEIAIASFGLLTVLDEDGQILWTKTLDDGLPGGVSIADVDGDGEVEIVTGTKYDDGTGDGRLYVINADGSTLWWAPAYDSTSANSASVLDLNGDGVYEIAWNGKEQGITVFNGVDGSALFNEPLVPSHTATDYPNIADVDNDGFAEIIVPALRGIHVVGFDHGWAPSRPLWNQHSYHITNVNDDLTVPFSEPNSWQIHNTYRTQTDMGSPAPNYSVALTYTAAVTNVSVLSGTFSLTPTIDAPAYRWDYYQPWYQPVMTRTFTSRLENMQPGEVRKLSEGVQLAYSLASGSNGLQLPPLYVQAVELFTLSPQSQSAPAGSAAEYTLTLSNPNPSAPAVYTITVSGPPGSWLSYPVTITVPAGAELIETITVQIPADAAAGGWPIYIDVTNGGGTSSANGELTIFDGVNLSINPPIRSADIGSPANYTVTITNLEASQQTYALSAYGLAAVQLPAETTVPAGSSVDLLITATATTGSGPLPFSVQATAASSASDTADAILEVPVQEASGRRVRLALAPDPASAGPGSTTQLTLIVTNGGDFMDSYALDVSLPGGWQYQLIGVGDEVDSVSLPPYLFNSTDLRLLVTPPAAASPGDYPITVTATSLADSGVSHQAAGTIRVGDAGVQVSLSPSEYIVGADGSGSWTVTITNTGAAAASFDLTAAGVVAAFALLSTDSVTLNAGESQTVQLDAADLNTLLPGSYPVAVAAVSQAQSGIQSQAMAQATIAALESVEIGWLPPEQTVADAFAASFTLMITNTGNITTTYDLTLTVPGASASAGQPQLLIPARSTVWIPVDVTASAYGEYTLTAAVSSAGGSAIAESSARLTLIKSDYIVLLPVILR